ncbi:phosphoadenylyl-sulfate reductase [Balneolales bacterium ANBcel1]|nr:phosphoadenylyl-sulfate reductase [Balneolales bacterium ANBcel1]
MNEKERPQAGAQPESGSMSGHSRPSGRTDSQASRISDEEIRRLNTRFRDAGPEQILQWTVARYGDDAVLSTGFGASGIVLMHQLSLVKPGAAAFYLDTDLLFGETYELIDRIRERMELNLVRVRPELSLDEQAEQYGDRLWETRPDQCCHIRKVLPLQRFLSDKRAWITGIRRDQSETRKHTELFAYDQRLDILKINPLASWPEEDVWSYIRINDLPYNELHDKGYPSIGCWPCTNPVSEGEDLRAGRWSGTGKTECGIHMK